MSLSTMQEIFVLLEDEKEVPFFRLKRWGRPARGALAKLKNMGFAEKSTIKDETIYKITEKGELYFDEVLEPIRAKNHWDKKWRMVMFEIPESNRALRDKLRRQLSNLGLGLLQASVWISPLDIKEKIDKISEELELGTQLKFFEVNSTPNLDQQIIEKSWNIPALNESLELFVKEAQWALKAMGKGNGDRYNAKKLIFDYAFILKKGPILPGEFIEHNEMRKKSHETYLKLRRYAV